MPIPQCTTSFIIRIEKSMAKTLLEKEASVLVSLTQKRLRNADNINFCEI